jgi:inner membrane protein
MDSLTQITLGAAVGEAVLGKKLGNRAMLWGAIGGTIPDLDVFANLVTDEMSAMAFHRAITHSFAFAFAAPLVLGYLLHKTYRRDKFWLHLGYAAVSLFVLLFLGTIFMPIPAVEVLKISSAVTATILFFPILTWLTISLRKNKPSIKPEVSWKSWSWLIFWAIFTHPLLDACTTYGTQLFQPFWDYRVAINNISVADPAYTLPFLLLVIAALLASRRYPLRSVLNYSGIAISSLYLLFTFYNKYKVDQVFKQSLADEGIQYERFMSSPTILNNVLWQGTAEGDTAFYNGFYSILDKEERVLAFTTIPKRQEIQDHYHDDRTLKILSWFSDGYWTMLERKDGSQQFVDLRFGTFQDNDAGEPEFIFSFELEEEDGQLIATPQRDPPGNGDIGSALQKLIERAKGI